MTNPITPVESFHTDPTASIAERAALQAAYRQLQQALSGLPQIIIQGLANAILNALGLGNFVGTFDGMLTAVENALRNIPVANIIGVLNSIDQALRDALADLLGGTGTGNTLAQLQAFLKQAFQGLFPALLDFLDGTLGLHPLGNLIANLDGTITILENLPGANALAMVFNNLDGTVTAIADTLHNEALNAKAWGTSVGGQVGQIANFFTAGNAQLNTLEAGLQQQFSGIATAIQDNFDGTVSLLTGMVNNLDGTVSGVIAQLGSIGQEVQTVIDNADGTLTNIGTFLQNLGNYFGTHQFSLASIQSMVDGLAQTIQNDLSQGNPVESFLSNLQTMMQTLFNQNTLGSLLSQYSIPNVLKAMSTDMQTVIDNAVNTLVGGNATGNPLEALITAFVSMPQGNVTPTPNPGTGSITHDNSTQNHGGTGAGTDNVTLTFTHSVTVGANYLVERIAFVVSPGGASWVVPAVTYAGVAMVLLASETVNDSAGNTLFAQTWGLFNPATGANSVSINVTTASRYTINGLNVVSDSYIGVATVGTAASNSGTNGSPSLSISSATGDEVVNGLAAFTTSSATETFSSYNQTIRSAAFGFNYSGTNTLGIVCGDAVGASTVTFSATASFTAQNVWVATALNLAPLTNATIGSGFRAANTSATATAITSGNQLLPSSFYAQTTATGDMTYAPTTNNKLTVANAGWYSVTVCILLSTAGTANFGPALFHNSSIYEVGTTLPTATIGLGPYKDKFIIYCGAGDTLQPGYSSSATSGNVAGEATGTKCYWSVSLLNRSIY